MENNNVCFCVHGGAQILVNPQVRLALSLPPIEIDKTPLHMQLETLRNSLTEKTWHKGSYFKHAAAASAGADATAAPAAFAAARRRDACAAEGAREAEGVSDGHLDVSVLEELLLEIWKSRSEYTRQHNDRYGNKNIHYLIGMFGLTISFNDDPETTLEMIHQKLDQAIDFARKHELYLSSN